MPVSQPDIIFFDGQCQLCNHFVKFVFKRDKNRQFLYAALQGQTARKHLQKKDIESLKSIVVWREGALFRESQAIQAVLKKLYPRLSFLFRFLPDLALNVFYNVVAKNRYRIFGRAKARITKEMGGVSFTLSEAPGWHKSILACGLFKTNKKPFKLS